MDEVKGVKDDFSEDEVNRTNDIIEALVEEYSVVVDEHRDAKIDEVMALLAWEMQLDVAPAGRSVPTVIPVESIVGPHQFRVPYHVNGSGKKLRGVDGLLGPRRAAPAVPAVWDVWDLRPGARIRLPAGPGKGFEGIVRGVGPDGHYRVELPNVREGDPMHGKGRCVFLLGSWWVEAATKGLVPQLPVVNATQGN